MTATFDRKMIARAAYEAGATADEIGAALGVCSTRVLELVVEAGGQQRRPGPRGRTDVPDSRIVALRDSDLPWSRVAAAVGMSVTGVQHRYRIATEGVRRDRRQPNQC